MAENLETIQLGREDFPTYRHLENELMSGKDHVVVVGEYLRKALGSLSEVPGFDLVRNNLKELLGVEIGNSLQLHTGSYILGGRNVFVIGPASSKAGKSLSYTIPIVSKLRLDAEKNSLISGSGPIALVICGTPKSGLKIEEALKWLTEDSGVEVEFVKDKSQQTEEHERSSRIRFGRTAAAASRKGCDVMVATAECAAAIINDPKSWFSFDRLTYVILDDAHVLFKYRMEYVRSILGAFKSYITKLGYCNRLVQTVVCGSQWSEEMENSFQMLCDNPVLIMGSPVQAIRFGKFGIQVIQVSGQAKFQSLKEILLRHEDARRVLVVASKWQTMDQLRSYFENEIIPIHFLIGEGEIGAATANARRKWNAKSERLIVFTTDGNLSELQIADADILIHFDIPQDDLRVFALRFWCMWRIVEDRVSHRKEAHKDKEETLSYVLLEEDLPQKNVILWKLHSLGASISSQMLKEATEAREASLDRQKLCEGFITTGSCTELDVMECNFRHHFVQADFDQQRVLPLCGQVELYITEVKSPNHFTAKVLRYISRDPVTKKVTSFIDFGAEAARRHELLKEAATSGAIRNGPSSAKPGTKVVVALRDKEDSRYVYTRGVIEEVVTRTTARLPKTCKVYCMDVGLCPTIRVDDIFGIPEEMESLPPCSLTVVLANTAPPFGEKKFHLLHMRKAKPNFQLDPKFQAEICLSIGGTIWVRRLVKMKKIPKGKVIEDWDATYNLCKQEILARNPGHMEKLYASCENVGFSCEEYRRLKKKVSWTNDIDFRLDYYQANDPYQWAHLRIHDENKSGIVSTTASPKFIDASSNVFVNQIDFEVLAENLETELTDEILELKASHDWNKDDQFESYYGTGLVVAALDEDGKYRRGMILEAEKEDGDSSKMRYHILLVDLGVNAWLPIEDLYPMPKKFVSKLPFQAIKLKLLHIRPRRAKSHNDKMHRAVIDILLRNDIPDDVEVVVFQKLDRSSALDPNTYEAFIFGADTELGETLVFMKRADFIDDGERRVRVVKEQLLEKFRSGIAELEDNDYGDDSDDDDLDFELGGELTKYLDKVVSDVTSNLKYGKAEAGGVTTEKQALGSIRLDNGPKPSVKCKEPQSEKTTIGSDGKVMKTPSVAWLQNTASVFIRVMLPDVAEYTCHVTDRITLIFQTIKPPNYGFTLKLSKRVESVVEVRPLGQYTEIKLKKRNVGVRWAVLTPTTGLRWLKPELEFEDDDNDDVEEKGRKLIETIPVDYEAMLEDLEDDDDEIFEIAEETDDYIE